MEKHAGTGSNSLFVHRSPKATATRLTMSRLLFTVVEFLVSLFSLTGAAHLAPSSHDGYIPFKYHGGVFQTWYIYRESGRFPISAHHLLCGGPGSAWIG